MTHSTQVWGIAGQIGSGKSTLGEYLTLFGAVNIEVDAIGHQLLDDFEIKKYLVIAFGTDILDENGAMNRRKLGKVAFLNPEATSKLNRIMHPPMIQHVTALISQGRNEKRPLIIVNAALLFSMGLHALCEKCIYVKANPEVRLERIISYRGIPMESAKARLCAQDPEPSGFPNTIMCENEGTLEDLKSWARNALVPFFSTGN